MEIEFDFKEEKSKIFGPILRAVARIILINRENEVPEHVYVDSGADITLIPKSVGELLGFKIEEDDMVEEMKGIGDYGIHVIIKKLKIKIGEKIIDGRIARGLIEDIPLLLGRIDVFKLFIIGFKNEKKTVFAD